VIKPFNPVEILSRVRAGERILGLERDLETKIRELEASNQDRAIAESRVRSVLDSARDAIVSLDESGAMATANLVTEELLAAPTSELLGRPFSEFIADAEDRAKIDDALAECRKHLQDRNDFGVWLEVVARRANGELFPAEIGIGGARAQGNAAFSASVRDLSERRRMEVELREAQKLESIGRLAAGVAHEINTPAQFVSDNMRFLSDVHDSLMPILKVVERIADSSSAGESVDAPSGEDASTEVSSAEEIVAEIRTAARDADLRYVCEEAPIAFRDSIEGMRRISTIVQAMKECSHPGADERADVDLNRLVERTITVSRNEWKYVAEVVTELDANLPLVPALAGPLNQVLLNLIVNAAHAIDRVSEANRGGLGTITIATSRRDGAAEITVTDTGCGVPAEIRDKIFEPFFTTKDVGKGTGQGLTIARSIVVEKHGGRLDCRSVPGEGATFTIRLPLESPSGTPAPAMP
jgi:PAS domain S-box-containing protein